MGSDLTLGTVLGAGILAFPFISAGVLVASNGKYSNLVRELGNQHGKQERTTAKATPTASQDTSSTHPVTGGCRALHWAPVPLWASLRVKAKPRSLPGPGHCKSREVSLGLRSGRQAVPLCAFLPRVSRRQGFWKDGMQGGPTYPHPP